MAQMGMGRPSPNTLTYITPAPSLQLPEPTVASTRQCIGCRATTANQIVTHQTTQWLQVTEARAYNNGKELTSFQVSWATSSERRQRPPLGRRIRAKASKETFAWLVAPSEGPEVAAKAPPTWAETTIRATTTEVPAMVPRAEDPDPRGAPERQ